MKRLSLVLVFSLALSGVSLGQRQSHDNDVSAARAEAREAASRALEAKVGREKHGTGLIAIRAARLPKERRGKLRVTLKAQEEQHTRQGPNWIGRSELLEETDAVLWPESDDAAHRNIFWFSVQLMSVEP